MSSGPGGSGGEFISGTPGNDALTGGDGNDTIQGNAGNDTISGGAGDDYLQGGGPGNPDVVWANAANGDLVRIELVDGQATTTLVGNTGVVLGDIGMAPDGNLYGVALSGGRIYQIDTQTGHATSTGSLPDSLNKGFMNALTFDGDGNAYTNSSTSDATQTSGILKFDPQHPEGATLWWTNPEGGAPSGDFVFTEGAAFLAWSGPDGPRLIRLELDENNQPLGYQTLGTLPNSAYGMSQGSDGTLYVLGATGVYQIDPPDTPLDHGAGPIPATLIPGTGWSSEYYGATSVIDDAPDTGDLLDGGDGNDTLIGDDGNDVIFGGDGNDLLMGGAGDDVIIAGTGESTVYGGEGADTILAGDQGDYYGDSGSDYFYVGPGLGYGAHFDGGEDADNSDIDRLDLTGAGPYRIVYDPDNRENGMVEFLDEQGTILGTITFANIEEIVTCFTPGTLICTAEGAVLIEDLLPGDMVLTRDAGMQPLRWIGRRDLAPFELVLHPEFAPVRIAQGALGAGLPERDMMVSPQHRMLISGPHAALLFGENEVLVPALHLAGRPGITRERPGPSGRGMQVSYIHLLFDSHQIVCSDGAWSESFQPRSQSLSALGQAQADEVLALFPELALGEFDRWQTARRSLRAHEARAMPLW